MGEVKSAAIMESLKLLCFLLPTCMALLSPPGGGRPGYLKPPESPDDVAFLEVGTASTAQVFNQKLDHFAPDDKRTFKQRYYVDSTFTRLVAQSCCTSAVKLRAILPPAEAPSWAQLLVRCVACLWPLSIATTETASLLTR